MQTDVLIAGAGPTGLALANQLARFGVDFVIVDKREGTTPHSKAIGVQARTLEIYDQLGIADKLVERGWRADRVRLLAGGEVRGELDLTTIGTGLSPFPFVLILEQGIHESILYNKLNESGRGVRWLTELREFTQDADRVSATIADADGSVEEISAKYLVGCDGSHSMVRKSLGLKFEGATFERLFYVADVDIDWEFPHDALHANLGDDTLTAFFPMVGDQHWRIVGTFPEGHEKDESDILFDEIERQVLADTSLKFDITKVYWYSVYKVHSRAVEAFSKGRCFLAGDSAHIHTPAGAQGMNTGIQDGYNLAWKLAAVLKDGSSVDLLETYNEERLPNAKRLLRTTDRFFDLAASDEWFTSFIRRNIFPYVANFAFSLDAVKQIVFPLVSQIGINYRESSLSETAGSFEVKAGDRMPWFKIGGRSIYGNLNAAKFHMLVFSDGASETAVLSAELLKTWSGRLDFYFYPLDETVKEAFGCSNSFLVILRPDNYIGLISDDGSSAAIENYLARFA